MGFYSGQLTLRKIVNHNIAIPAVFMSMQRGKRKKKLNKKWEWERIELSHEDYLTLITTVPMLIT